MSLPRVFCEDIITRDSERGFVALSQEALHHLRVRRVRPGEHIALVEGRGIAYEVCLTSYEDEGIGFDFVSGLGTEQMPHLTLFQAVSKGDRMERVLRACTELGVERFVPVLTARCVVRLDNAQKRAAKAQRWSRIVASSAEQAARTSVPEVEEPLSFRDACMRAQELDLVICPYELAEQGSLHDACSSVGPDARIGLFVGPEGGFERSEVEELEELGTHIITLGSTILRTETAGVVASALTLYELGALGAGNRKYP